MIEPSYDSNSDNDLGKIHCNFNRWTFYLGLVMFIVPITVRLRAINNIFAKVDKKLSHDHGKNEARNMGIILLSFVSLTIVYLIIWTAIDPDEPTIEYNRIGQWNELESKVEYSLHKRYVCESASNIDGKNEFRLLPIVLNAFVVYLWLYGFSIAHVNSSVKLKKFNDGFFHT